MWKLDYPRMDEKNFISFEDYKKKSYAKIEAKTETYADKHEAALRIMAEADEIRKSDRLNPNNMKGVDN